MLEGKKEVAEFSSVIQNLEVKICINRSYEWLIMRTKPSALGKRLTTRQ